MGCRLVEEVTREKYAPGIGRVARYRLNDLTARGDMDFGAARPLCMVCGSDETRFTHPADAERTASYSEISAKKPESLYEDYTQDVIHKHEDMHEDRSD